MMDILMKKIANVFIKRYLEKNFDGINAEIEHLNSKRVGEGTELDLNVKVNVKDDEILNLILKKMSL